MIGAISDNEIDNRLKAARTLLGDEPGETVEGNTAIVAVRRALDMLGFGLIAAGVKRDNGGGDGTDMLPVAKDPRK